jgi:hypothetical protein
VERHFQGIENCFICYSVFHQSNKSLPRLGCYTCKNKFHSECLYRWFHTSQKSQCPLCQSIWKHEWRGERDEATQLGCQNVSYFILVIVGFSQPFTWKGKKEMKQHRRWNSGKREIFNHDKEAKPTAKFSRAKRNIFPHFCLPNIK